MQVELYNYQGKKNVVAKTLGEPLFTRKGTLRKATSLTRPVRRFQGDPSVFASVNYAYIKEFNRYYYVTDIVSETNRIVTLTMESDPLMSFQSAVKSATGSIIRSSDPSTYDITLQDPLRSMTAKSYKQLIPLTKVKVPQVDRTSAFFPSKFLPPDNDLDTLKYVVLVTSNAVDVASGKDIPVQRTDTDTTYGDIYDIVFGSSSHSDTATRIVQCDYRGRGTNVGCIFCNGKALKKISDYIIQMSLDTRAIVKIRQYPFDLKNYVKIGVSPREKIRVGFEGDAISLSQSNGELAYTADGFAINEMDLTIDKNFLNSYRYSAWRRDNTDKYQLWIPYYGWVDLPMRQIFSPVISGQKESVRITLTYIVNPYSGFADFYLCDQTAKTILFTGRAQVGTDVPVTTTDLESNREQQEALFTTGLTKVTTQAIIGAAAVFATACGFISNPVVGVGTAVSAFAGVANTGASVYTQLNRLTHDNAQTTQVGISSSFAYQYLDVVLCITITDPTFPDYEVSGSYYAMGDYIADTGLPAYKTAKLASQFTGSSVFFTASVTDRPRDDRTKDEYDAILSSLGEGVYTR